MLAWKWKPPAHDSWLFFASCGIPVSMPPLVSCSYLYLCPSSLKHIPDNFLTFAYISTVCQHFWRIKELRNSPEQEPHGHGRRSLTLMWNNNTMNTSFQHQLREHEAQFHAICFFLPRAACHQIHVQNTLLWCVWLATCVKTKAQWKESTLLVMPCFFWYKAHFSKHFLLKTFFNPKNRIIRKVSTLQKELKGSWNYSSGTKMSADWWKCDQFPGFQEPAFLEGLQRQKPVILSFSFSQTHAWTCLYICTSVITNLMDRHHILVNPFTLTLGSFWAATRSGKGKWPRLCLVSLLYALLGIGFSSVCCRCVCGICVYDFAFPVL